MGSLRASNVSFILLGASNLARGHIGFSKFLQQALPNSQVDFFYALGPGRCYCAWGGVMGKSYSPIRNSGIFNAVKDKSPAACRRIALVSDIGNDILYGIKTEEVIAELERTFDRLRDLGADLFVNPIPSIFEVELNRNYYFILRTIFYPTSRVSYESTLAAVKEINRFLKSSAKNRFTLISKLESYAGWDRIHYSIFKMHLAWTKIGRDMLNTLGISHLRNVQPLNMAASLLTSGRQLFFNDILAWGPRGLNYY